MRQSLKYEFKQNWKDFLISYIILFSTFVILSIFLLCIKNINNTNTFLIIMYTNIIGLVVLAFTGSFIVFAINVIRGCYTKIFGDEGYLTLSLPISTHKIILSKIIANVIWFIIYALVGFIGLILTTLVSADSVNEILNSIKDFAEGFLKNIQYMPFLFFNGLIQVVLALVTLILSFCIINLTTVKKGKIILGILIYSGISTGINVLLSITRIFGFGLAPSSDGGIRFVTGTDLGYGLFLGMNGYLMNFSYVLVSLGLIVGGYFLIIYLLNKKIELE